MIDKIKILEVRIKGSGLDVEGDSTFTTKGEHLIMWVLIGQAAWTGGILKHQWCDPQPGNNTFSSLKQVGIFGFMIDKSRCEKKTYPYELTLKVGTTVYSTGSCLKGGGTGSGGNPNIKND